MAVPALDSADLHFPLQAIIKIQNSPATAYLLSRSKCCIFLGRKWWHTNTVERYFSSARKCEFK